MFVWLCRIGKLCHPYYPYRVLISSFVCLSVCLSGWYATFFFVLLCFCYFYKWLWKNGFKERRGLNAFEVRNSLNSMKDTAAASDIAIYAHTYIHMYVWVEITICMYIFSYYLFWRCHDFVSEDAAQAKKWRQKYTVLLDWCPTKRVGNVFKKFILLTIRVL